MSGWYPVGSSGWWAGNWFNTMSRFAVPVFLMLTGALILPKYDGLKPFFRKRFGRILPPFIFWSVVYFVVDLFGRYAAVRAEGDWLEVLRIFVDDMAFGGQYHLWYIYMLLGLYLFMPVLAVWIRNATEKEIKYFLAVWLVVLVAGMFKNFTGEYLRYFGGYAGYLVLGYYLANKEFKKSSRSLRRIGAGLDLAGFLITFVGTYLISRPSGEMNEFLYRRTMPNVLLCAVGIFLFVKNLPERSKQNRVTGFIESEGYGIYLVHALVINVLGHLGLRGALWHPAIWIPVTTVLCLFISVAVILGIRKIPYCRYISG